MPWQQLRHEMHRIHAHNKRTNERAKENLRHEFDKKNPRSPGQASILDESAHQSNPRNRFMSFKGDPRPFPLAAPGGTREGGERGAPSVHLEPSAPSELRPFSGSSGPRSARLISRSLSRPQSAEPTDEDLSALRELFLAYHDRLERAKTSAKKGKEKGEEEGEGAEEGQKEDEVRSEEEPVPPPDALQKAHNQDMSKGKGKGTFFSAGRKLFSF